MMYKALLTNILEALSLFLHELAHHVKRSQGQVCLQQRCACKVSVPKPSLRWCLISGVPSQWSHRQRDFSFLFQDWNDGVLGPSNNLKINKLPRGAM